MKLEILAITLPNLKQFAIFFRHQKQKKYIKSYGEIFQSSTNM